MIVSVIIPTYNYAQFITNAVQSVLIQNTAASELEIIVVDDGSTDDTHASLHPFISARSVRYYWQQNKGKAAATRKGIELARGEIILNLDADDYFLPGKIEKTIALFNQFPKLVHVASPALLVYDQSNLKEVEPVPMQILSQLMEGTELLKFYFTKKLLYGGGSTFAAKASVLKNMKWDDAVDMYTDEWLLVECLLKGEAYLYAEPLSAWRIHGKNYSGKTLGGRHHTKQQRMLESSAAVLRLIETGDYPAWLKKQYRLKHEIRKMVWKEESDDKYLADIFRFIRNGIFSGNSLSVLRNYRAFNRLIPTGLLHLLSRR